jgi:hypothetical protein
MQILSLLLPSASSVKVLCFSDCRLDGEMLQLLRKGLAGCNGSIESLQIEWNPFEIPLPSPEEMPMPSSAPPAGAGSDPSASPEGEASPNSGVQAEAEAGAPVDAEGAATPAVEHSLEAREMRRYQLQSWRLLRSFREWLEDLAGSLDEAFAQLSGPEGGVDLEARLAAGDLHALLEARLGAAGPHVTEVYEALDGPDFGGGQGFTSLAALRSALEGLPEQTEAEEANDPIGSMLAPFVDIALQSLSLRACSIGRLELGPICARLTESTSQLRCLNLWENGICDRGANVLANAFDEYRTLEYLGLGRNRITVAGLIAICKPFDVEVVSEAEAKEMRDAALEAAEKARAAELKNSKKPPPKKGEEPPPEELPPLKISLAGRTRGEGSKAATLEERPNPQEGAEPTLLWRRACELRTLALSDNPIQGVRGEKEIEALQPLGPKGAELLLIGTPAAASLAARRPDLTTTGNRKFAVGSEGWVLKLL